MKDKDRFQKRTSSGDNTKRFIVLEFTGWYIGSMSNPQVWDSDPIMAPPRKTLTLTYKLLGKDQIYRLPFPHNKPHKKNVQWQTCNLSHLIPGHFYAAWIINSAQGNQPDDWYWVRTLELTKKQAEEVRKAKFSRKYRDAWMDNMEVQLIAGHGHPHGQRIYDDIKRKHGNPNKVEMLEIMRISKAYWEEQTKIPRDIQNILNEYFKQVKTNKLLEL